MNRPINETKRRIQKQTKLELASINNINGNKRHNINERSEPLKIKNMNIRAN